MSKEDLKAQAKELGIDVDGRWSEDRLKAEIEQASAIEANVGGEGFTPDPMLGEANELAGTAKEKSELIKMTHDKYGKAAVHPDMAEEYKQGEWKEV